MTRLYDETGARINPELWNKLKRCALMNYYADIVVQGKDRRIAFLDIALENSFYEIGEDANGIEENQYNEILDELYELIPEDLNGMDVPIMVQIKLTPNEYAALALKGFEKLETMESWGYSGANISPEQLLEAFAADLAGSNRSGGSDERDYAQQWLDRQTGLCRASVDELLSINNDGKNAILDPATVTLSGQQSHAVELYIRMSTKYRIDEAETWAQLAQETNGDGTPRFPKAAGNAAWWEKANAELNAIAAYLSDHTTGRIRDLTHRDETHEDEMEP